MRPASAGGVCFRLIGIAARKVGFDSVDILSLIARNLLSNVRYETGKYPLQKIYVNLAEVISVLLGMKEPLMVMEATNAFAIPDNILRHAAKTGVLPAKVRHRRNGTQYYFERANLEAFQENYTTTHQLGKKYGPKFHNGQRLRELGVQPVFVCRGVTLYRVTEVEAAMQK